MDSNYISQVLDHVQRNHNVKGTATGIMYQTGYAAAGAGTGGLLGGPLGAMIGTIFGAVYGYTQSDSYSSVFGIIRNLNPEDQQNLASMIRNHVGGVTLAEFANWFKDLNHQAILIQLLTSYAATRQR